LALFLYAALNQGKVFSWDTNGSKGHFLRSVVSDAICMPLGVNVNEIWTFIGFDSTNKHVGIPVLKELEIQADYCIFDSWHTLNHLMDEIFSLEMVSSDSFLIALDDAYYQKRDENYSFLNMIRKKLNLRPVSESDDNICDPFHIEIDRYLNEKYKVVKKITDTYKIEYSNDLFFDYYQQDRKVARNE